MAAFTKYITGMPISATPATQLSMSSEESASGAIPAPPQGLFRRASARMTNSLKRRSVSVNDIFSMGPPVSEPEEKSVSSNTEKEGTERFSIGSGVTSSAPSSPGIIPVGPIGERYAGNAVVYTEVSVALWVYEIFDSSSLSQILRSSIT